MTAAPPPSSVPASTADLFAFYYEKVKPLYGFVQSDNVLPTEMLFEINAAFDHLSRHWQYGEAEAESVAKAHSHLKRTAIDICKIRLRDTLNDFKDLLKAPVDIIDNGAFKRDLNRWRSNIRRIAQEARTAEGKSNHDDLSVPWFDGWMAVMAECDRFYEEFYDSEHVPWARKKHLRSRIAGLFLAGVGGVIVGLSANWIWAFLQRFSW